MESFVQLNRPDGLSISLRALNAFCAVADAGSIAQAAESLSRVSSAVAKSVSELEASFGVVLFSRHARGVALTSDGQVVLERARRVSAQFSKAKDDLVSKGGVRVDSAASSVFASIINGRRIAIFSHLVDGQSMSAVARAFSVTQPAISASVKDFEERLKTPLFVRSARGLVPTLAAEILGFHFKHVLAEIRHAFSDLAAAHGTIQGSIHVGALPLGRTDVLPRAIASMLSEHPKIHVTTIESPYAALVALLQSGGVDFILGALRESDSKELLQDFLFEDQLALVARSDHPLARASEISFDMLRDAAWVLPREGSPSRELLDAFFVEARQPPPIPAVETGDLAVLRGLLFETDILTAISLQQVRYEISNGSLVCLNFALTRTTRPIGIAQRVGASNPLGVKLLIEKIKAVSMGP